MDDLLARMSRLPLALLLLALGLLAPRCDAQDEAQLETLRRLVDALRGNDFRTLAELTDFEGRAAERLARGLDDAPWGQLDELERLGRQQLVLREWAGSGQGFNQRASFAGAEPVADPDQGLGPVPDRSIVRLRLRHQTSGQYRDLLVVLAPDRRVLDLEQGPPYHAGANPAGEQGLLPVARLSSPLPATLTWPADQDADERDSATELVDALLAAPDAGARALARERLQRSPHVAVAALLERLVALEAPPGPDTDAQAPLVEALEQITGRDTPWSPAPMPGVSREDWLSSNGATLAAWLRWHAEQGWTFAAAPIVDPLEPALLERIETAPLPAMDRWTERLAQQLEDARDPEDAPAGAAAPTTAAPDPAPAPPVPDQPASPPPAAEARPRPPGPRDILFRDAADMELSHRGRKTTGREIESLLAPEQREALNAWAQPARDLGLTIVLGERPEHLVLGFKPGPLMVQAAGWLDDAAARLAPAVPVLPPREPRCVVALLFDAEDSRSPAWGRLLDDLVARQLLLETSAAELRLEPAGLLRRQAGLFLQPTWDMAGNAAAGDDEFRAGNEVVGKFAQCLLTARCGEMPATILWAIDYVAEIERFDSVYQFDTTGFVASADHFDWRKRTAQHLAKLAKQKNASLGAIVAQLDQAGRPSQPQMIAWGALAWLLDHRPEALAPLLTDLAALQSEVDRRGRSSVWRGDADRTREVLAAHLDALDPKALQDWLDDE